MRRVAIIAMGLALVLTGRCLAQQTSLSDLHDKSPITDDDRQKITAWVSDAVKKLATASDATVMVNTRDAILAEGRHDPAYSKDFVQVFGEEAIKVLTVAEQQSLSGDARLNVVMTVAGLERVEGIGLLQKVLTGDPYPATRYWAAKGLSEVAAAIVAEDKIRAEQEVAKSIGAAFQGEMDALTLYYLFGALGQFDHEDAHDVLAQGVLKLAVGVDAADAAGVQTLGEMIRGVEKAYTSEVRAEAKTRLLSAYAALCCAITPPVNDPTLMATLNASIEKVTGESVGFKTTDRPEVQKMALLEWVERMVRSKRMPSRPPMPPAVEQAVRGAMGVAPEPEPAVEPAPTSPKAPEKAAAAQ